MKVQKQFVKAKIPFNRPYLTGKEIECIRQSLKTGWISGNGFYTQKCHKWLEEKLGCLKSFLTTSGTAALEMIAFLAKIKPGDEVILPSFTFVTTASAFVLRGAIPIFVDIREDTLNIDERIVEEAITKKTKALVVVHYAGVACEMGYLSKIARKHKLLLIEDAAQALFSVYKGKYLGTFGEMSAISFHETKNVISGEGGAILVNTPSFLDKAEIVWEKGTNRSKFLRGEIDKYTWVDLGSSYAPSDIIAAFLLAQLEKSKVITKKRVELWNAYDKRLEVLETRGYIRRPVIPLDCKHNGHLYYILVDKLSTRNKLINYLKKGGIMATFHYVPLHSSPAGKKYGKFYGEMKVTNRVSETLVRLPLFYSLSLEQIDYTVKKIMSFFKK